MSLSKPWSVAETFHWLGSLAKVPLMKRPLTTPAKKSLGKYKQPAELRLWLRFFEGAGLSVLDFSRYGNNGVIAGTVWGRDGGLTVGDFNGAVDKLNCGVGASLVFERTDPFSIYIVLKTASVAVSEIISKENQVSARGHGFLLMNTGVIRIQLINAYPANTIEVDSVLTVNNGQQRGVCVTYDGSSLAAGVNIYINSILSAMIINFNTLTLTILVADSLTVASRQAILYWLGLLYETRLYAFQLSGNEQRALYLGLI